MADNGMGPQVSVLTPIYNTHAEYLRECIDSVLAQTFSDFEFIILDNASDAYVAELVASYDDPRIRYFRVDENIGPAGGRNFCIARARGKYLAILDSDDVALPERLAAQVAFMDAHPSVGVLGTFSRTTEGGAFFSDTLPTDSDAICRHLLFCGNMLCHSSVMMRTPARPAAAAGTDAGPHMPDHCVPAKFNAPVAQCRQGPAGRDWPQL